MPRFRLHRGGLQESLKTTMEYDGWFHLCAHIKMHTHPAVHLIGNQAFPFEKRVTVKPYGGDDSRIGWKDVHVVLLDGAPFGFCEGNPCREKRL